jgi:hypothetical protein
MGTKADLVRDLANGRVAHGTGCIGKSADDEPIFVICARDPLGALIVRAWATGAIAHRVNPDKIAGALRIAEAMDAWQIAHPNQIKVAD